MQICHTTLGAPDKGPGADADRTPTGLEPLRARAPPTGDGPLLSAPDPARPDLVAVDHRGEPLLRAQRCGRCSTVAFPPQPYGCETCGAPATEADEEQVVAAGRVLARATVHRDLLGHPVPYTVAEIALDAGPAARVLLASPTGEDVSIGTRVRGVLRPPGSGGPGGGAELVFVPEPAGSGTAGSATSGTADTQGDEG